MMIFKEILLIRLGFVSFKNARIKTWTAIILLLFTFSGRAFSQCLVWQDEFNTTSLDLSKWKYTTGNGCGGSSGCGFGNGELQYYTSGTNNITLGGGNLSITAKYQPNYLGSGTNYTSGKISTQGIASWKYGRMEARIQVPSATAIWPAFWMLSDNGNWPYSGEIDIMETQNTNTNVVNQTIHYYCTPCGNHQYTGVAYNNGTNWAGGFHTYAVDWTPGQIKYSVDGVTTATYTPASLTGGNAADWTFDASNFFNILNLAVGGAYTGNATPNSANYPQTMLVDYVRVYSNSFSFNISGQKVNYVGDQKFYGITDAGATATYTWSVPAGATIVSGQGTKNISVNYASALSNNITCSVDGDGAGSTCTPVVVTYPIRAIVKTCGIILDNFEGSRNLLDLYANGTLSVVANPGAGGSNTSATVGKYDRNSGATYDIIGYGSFLVDNADDFRTGARFFTMDVRTNAPAGTPITIEFDNSTQMVNAYPAGRHSQYTATTGAPNTWNKLTFTFSQSPDGALTANDVDRLQILFNPNSNVVGQTFYFDNFIAQGKTPVTSAMTGLTTACLSQTNVPFSVTNTVGSTYAWTANNGATIASGQGTSSVTVNFGTGNSTVSVVETTSALCTGTAVTKTVTVSGPCTLTPNFTATPLSTCVGNTIIFTNTTTGASGGETYAWDFGAGATPATSAVMGPVNVTYTSGGSKTITLTVTKAGVPTPVTKTNYITIANPPTTCLYSDDFNDGTVNFNASSPSFTNSETGGARHITSAGHGEWDTFTHTLNNGTAAAPINFSCAANKPLLKIRVKASSNCLLRVTMVDGTGRAVDNYGALDLAITTTYQTFSIDYAKHFTNTYGGSPGIVDSTNITQLLFYINPGFASFPVAGYNTAFNGTLDIDWEGIGNSCNVPGTAPTITNFTPACGAASTSVTITGANLTGATSVIFNGTAGTITNNTATQIIVTAPAGVTAGPITVNTTAGSVASATNFSLAVVASVSIASNPVGSICAGTSVTYTATPTNGGTPAYQWQKNNTNVTGTGATYTTTGLVNGDVITVIMTPTGCTTTSTATSNAMTAVVTTPVVASVSIAANPVGAICAGTSVTYTATPTNGGTPAYQWQKNGTNVTGTGATYTTTGL
ncbi:MAG: family 16 glycosylhydrolase, partial [Cytophagaceae bacterium]|nr:family 16 glycosylhydrolase [Cytophagaceae bacterium]